MTYIPETHRKGRRLIRRWGVAQTGQIAREGTVEQWEHWDGSIDANVRLRPFRIRVRPEGTTDPQTMRLVASLEQAIRENEQARQSGDEAWHRLTAARVVGIKEKLAERIGNG